MNPWTTAQTPDLTGRTAVVTGANAGLGLEITRGLAAAGAHVVMACRNPGKAEAAAASVRQMLPSAQLEVVALDLADLASVRAAAAEITASHPRLDLLVNNAGLMALDAARTADGFEMQLGVNHLGHHALTALLLPAMVDVPGSRVATMSSMGHRGGHLQADDLMWERRGYSRWGAYFQSKLANLLFTADLDRRLRAARAATIAVAAHPGASHTDLGTEGSGLFNRLSASMYPYVTQSAARGAEPMLRAATDPDVTGGQYYGPRWYAAGPAVLQTPSRRARSVADARTLAAASEVLTGIALPV